MTHQEKAKELTYNVERLMSNGTPDMMVDLIINEIEKALTDYGTVSFELQNMDNEFRWWDNVRKYI